MLPDYFEIQKELQTTCREIDGHLKVMDQMIQRIGTAQDTTKARQDFARVRKSVSVKLGRVSELIRTHSDAIDEHTQIEYQRLTNKSRTNNDRARLLHRKSKPYQRSGVPSQTEKEPLIKRGSSSYTGYDSTSSLSHQSSSRHRRQQKPKMADDKSAEQMLSYKPYSQLEETQSEMQQQQSSINKQSLMDPQWMANVKIIDASSILEEREEKMHNFKEQMTEIKESFETLHEAVDLQSVKVDTLTDNIQSIVDDTKGGNEQLIKAESKLAKKRRIKCYLLIFLVLVIAVLVCIIVWYETHSHSNNKRRRILLLPGFR